MPDVRSRNNRDKSLVFIVIYDLVNETASKFKSKLGLTYDIKDIFRFAK